MSWKGFGRKRLWPSVKALLRHSPRTLCFKVIQLGGLHYTVCSEINATHWRNWLYRNW